MSSLMTAVGAFAVKHGPVAFGLIVGTAAKFGRMLAVGYRPTARMILGHCLMMFMVGLVATVLVDLAGIEAPDIRAFTAAVLAVAASDVVKYLATRAWKKFFNDLVNEERGELRQDVQRARSARSLINDAESGEIGQ